MSPFPDEFGKPASLSSLSTKGLKEYDGDLAIGAFGIVNRIVFLFVMIVMGLNQGMQPLPDTISVPVNTIG